MPYISTDLTKKIRQELKKEFPEYRFSVRNRNHTGISVTILKAPFELRTDPSNTYESVNHYHIDKYYDGEAKTVLTTILQILNQYNGTEHESVDYGSIPKYYVRLSIGSFERPFEVISSKKVQPSK